RGHRHVGHPAGAGPHALGADLGAAGGRRGQSGQHDVEEDGPAQRQVDGGATALAALPQHVLRLPDEGSGFEFTVVRRQFPGIRLSVRGHTSSLRVWCSNRRLTSSPPVTSAPVAPGGGTGRDRRTPRNRPLPRRRALPWGAAGTGGRGGDMRLTILGGGGFRVPLVHRALLADAREPDPAVTEVVLVDTAPERLAAVPAVLDRQRDAHRAAYGEPPLTVRTADTLADALRGCAVVFSAIRVGGTAGRVLDERVALDAGVLGQETVGAGGISYGLRTVPVAV